MHEIHDWGSHMDKFLEDFEARGGWSQFNNGTKDARGNAKDATLGHEDRVRREYGGDLMVPSYDGYEYGGKDPGLFWNDSEF